jgi:hypothetical protein
MWEFLPRLGKYLQRSSADFEESARGMDAVGIGRLYWGAVEALVPKEPLSSMAVVLRH